MKKLLAILMVLAMLLSFAACGGNENPDAGDNAGGNDNPDTGDSSNLILWSVLGIASLLCVAVLLVILYRKKGKYQSR